MTTAATPRDPGQPGLLTRAARMAAVGLGMAVGVATALQSALAQDSGYPLRVGAVFFVIVALAVRGLPAHPFTRIGPANVVTGGRAIVMALLAGVAIGPRTPETGWGVVLIATLGALADALDGSLARRTGLASRFGARFDMEVDALLILVLSALAWRAVPIGAWVLASGLLRYAFVAAGWVLPWMTAALPPSRRRQTVCVVQIVGLVVALSPVVSPEAARTLSAAALVLLAWSFAVDVWRLFVTR